MQNFGCLEQQQKKHQKRLGHLSIFLKENDTKVVKKYIFG